LRECPVKVSHPPNILHTFPCNELSKNGLRQTRKSRGLGVRLGFAELP